MSVLNTYLPSHRCDIQPSSYTWSFGCWSGHFYANRFLYWHKVEWRLRCQDHLLAIHPFKVRGDYIHFTSPVFLIIIFDFPNVCVRIDSTIFQRFCHDSREPDEILQRMKLPLIRKNATNAATDNPSGTWAVLLSIRGVPPPCLVNEYRNDRYQNSNLASYRLFWMLEILCWWHGSCQFPCMESSSHANRSNSHSMPSVSTTFSIKSTASWLDRQTSSATLSPNMWAMT